MELDGQVLMADAGTSRAAIVCLVNLGGVEPAALGQIGVGLAARLGAGMVDARPFAFESARGGFTWADVDEHASELDGKALLSALPNHPVNSTVGLLSSGVRGAVGRALRVGSCPAVVAVLTGLASQGGAVVLEPPPQCVPEGALWLGIAGKGAHRWRDLPARALALSQAASPAGAACLALLGSGPRAWDAALGDLCSRVSPLTVKRVALRWWRRGVGEQVSAALARWIVEEGATRPGVVREVGTASAGVVRPPFRFLPVSAKALSDSLPTGEQRSDPPHTAVSWLPEGGACPQRRERHQARRAA